MKKKRTSMENHKPKSISKFRVVEMPLSNNEILSITSDMIKEFDNDRDSLNLQNFNKKYCFEISKRKKKIVGFFTSKGKNQNGLMDFMRKSTGKKPPSFNFIKKNFNIEELFNGNLRNNIRQKNDLNFHSLPDLSLIEKIKEDFPELNSASIQNSSEKKKNKGIRRHSFSILKRKNTKRLSAKKTTIKYDKKQGTTFRKLDSTYGKSLTRLKTKKGKAKTKFYFSQLLFCDLLRPFIRMNKLLNTRMNKSLYLKDLPANYGEEIKDSLQEYREKDFSNKMNNINMSLFWTIISIHRGECFVILILCLGEVVTQLFYTVFINYVLEEIEQRNVTRSLFYGTGLSLCIMTNFFFGQFFMIRSNKLAIKIRLLLIKIVFSKINALSSTILHKYHFGKIVNILTNGLNAIENKLFLIFYLIMSPIAFSMSMYLFYRRFYYISLVGIFTLMIIYPFQYFISKSNALKMRKKSANTEFRLKICQEIIENYRQIKMNSLENKYIKILNDFRNKELSFLKRISLLNYMERSFSYSSLFIAAILTFWTFWYLKNKVSASLVFSTMQLLSFMRTYTIMNVGSSILFIQEIRIIISRISEILKFPEMEIDTNNNFSPEEKIYVALKFDKYTASWKHAYDSKNEMNPEIYINVLQNISYIFKKGKKYLILGEI